MHWLITVSLLLCIICRIQQLDQSLGHFLISKPIHDIRRQYNQPSHKHFINLDTKFYEYPSSDSLPLDHHHDKPFLQPLRGLCLSSPNTNPLLPPSQQLQQFKQSHCSPILIVPGLMATKLIVQINCEQLQTHHPDIFSNCGWNSCSKKWFDFTKAVPEQEYVIWVGINLMMTPFFRNGLDRRCFGDLISLVFQHDTKQFREVRGANITWFGNTPLSKDYSNCGNNAITNLMGFSKFAKNCEMRGQLRLLQSLKTMGYQSGVTLQSLPYDWRRSLQDSDTSTRIVKAIKHLYSVTGKKVVVVAHSLGGLHSVHALSYFMEREEKERMVRELVAVGTPFGGSAGTLRLVFAGKNNLFKEKKILFFKIGFLSKGINFYTQNKVVSTSGFVMDIIIRPTLNQQYWQLINKRIAHQQDPSANANPFPWYPSLQQCQICRLGLINFYDRTPILKIQKQYSFFATQTDYQQMFSILDPFIANHSIRHLFKKRMAYKNNLDAMPHPGVPVTLIFSNSHETDAGYEFQSMGELVGKHAVNREFIENVNKNRGIGDGTVLATSVLHFVPEWERTSTSDHPTKLILYSNNPLPDGLQQKYPNFKVIPTECSDISMKDDKKCRHSCMVNDKFIVEAILNITTNSGKGYEGEGERPARLTDQEVLAMQIDCRAIRE